MHISSKLVGTVSLAQLTRELQRPASLRVHLNRAMANLLLPTLAVLAQGTTAMATVNSDAPEPAYDLSMALRVYAKVVCSAVFVSGRDPSEAIYNSGYGFLPPLVDAKGAVVANSDAELRSFSLDEAERTVMLELRSGETAVARYIGDQGCIIPVDGYDGLLFRPVEVVSELPGADELEWPMGDVLPSADPLAANVRRRVEGALDEAFSPGLLTHSFLVVHKGRIVAERYDLGISKDTQVEGWSMGKSLTAILFGVLAHSEGFKLNEPAAIPEWSDLDDPRREVTHADLLRMSSGLRFTSGDSDKAPWETGVPDHLYPYMGAVDVFDYVLNRPLENAPNQLGRYRNSDPLAIGSIIRRTVEANGHNYWRWPQRNLFDKIGIREHVLETDLSGNFLLTGFVYGTARNWARLALLLLQDGVWNDSRLLPEGWADFMQTPAPAWTRGEYGGSVWINSTGRYALPRNASYFSGGGAINRVFMIPQWEMIIVRLGHMRGYWGDGYADHADVTDDAEAHLNRALSKLSEALGYSSASTSGQ